MASDFVVTNALALYLMYLEYNSKVFRQHVCVCVCVYVHVCECACVCVCMCMCACMCVCLHACVCVCAFVCDCVRACVRVLHKMEVKRKFIHWSKNVVLVTIVLVTKRVCSKIIRHHSSNLQQMCFVVCQRDMFYVARSFFLYVFLCVWNFDLLL